LKRFQQDVKPKTAYGGIFAGHVSTQENQPGSDY